MMITMNQNEPWVIEVKWAYSGMIQKGNYEIILTRSREVLGEGLEGKCHILIFKISL